MPRSSLLLPLVFTALLACSSDDGNGSDGSSDAGEGAAGNAGAASNAGASGTLSNAGSSGNAGTSGNAGGGSSGEGGGGAGAGGGGGETPSGDGDLAELTGTFLVRYIAQTATAPALSTVLGRVKDGDEPESMIWTETDRVGDCVLLEPSWPFCEESCAPDGACVAEDTCAAFPEAQDVGPIEVSGLGEDFTMRFVAGNYQSPTLDYPPCEEGATVQMTTGGGGYPPFSLEGTCIAPLEFSGPVAIADGQPIPLTWSSPGQADLTRIKIKLDISHHGGVKGKIECDTADTGSLEIAASLSDQLVALGVAGFPTIAVTRVAAGATNPEGPASVQLNVSETVEILVDVPGVESCTDDSNCSEGKTCQTDLRCL